MATQHFFLTPHLFKMFCSKVLTMSVSYFYFFYYKINKIYYTLISENDSNLQTIQCLTTQIEYSLSVK